MGYFSNVDSVYISQVTNSEEVESTSYGNSSTGGIIGQAATKSDMTIINTSNSGKITCGGYGGGIIGQDNGGNATLYMENCYNTGDISYTGYSIGGLIGLNDHKLKMEACYNKGNLNGTGGENTGGLIGFDDASAITIESCYNTGNITGIRDVAGLVGRRANYTGSSYILIYNSYNTGKISGVYFRIAGLISEANLIDMRYCYNTGDVILEHQVSSGRICEGGLCAEVSGGNIISCTNSGNIYSYNSSDYTGGIIAHGKCNIYNCSNTGDIIIKNSKDNHYIGGIAGDLDSGGMCEKVSNTGNIVYKEPINRGGYVWIGGIIGSFYSGEIKLAYNTGNIDVSSEVSGDIGGILGCFRGGGSINNTYNNGTINVKSQSIYIGGIAGEVNGQISNSYNTAQIVNNNSSSGGYGYVGGIAGRTSAVVVCYNIASIYNNISNLTGNSIGTGPICGSIRSSGIAYYQKGISVVGLNTEDSVGNTVFCQELTEDYMKSEQFYTTLNNSNGLWLHLENQYPILNIAVLNNSSEVTELLIGNTKKKFDITTEVGKNSLGDRTGGDITGEYTDKYTKENNKKYIETVNYGEQNSQDINIVPEDENYKIQSITINGEDIAFSPDEEDGSYTIPANYFKDVQQNYNIVATFAKYDEVLTINKTDEQGNKLSGAKFEISSEYLDEYSKITQLTADGQYYLVMNGQGHFVPNNLTTGGTASSYYEIDLTDLPKDEYLAIIVNAELTGSGLVTAGITEGDYSKETSTYNSSDRFENFMFISSETSEQDYVSEPLQGGKKYYLHINYNGYFPSVIINSIKMRKLKMERALEDELVNNGEYYFENKEQGYVPNNLELTGTTANSYIPINLSGKEGKYIVRVDTVSKNSGLLFGRITDNTNAITTDDSPIEKCSVKNNKAGEKSYCSTILDGNGTYYLQLGFRNPTTQDSSDVAITGITLEKLEPVVIKETNTNGQIVESWPNGTYKITEIKAPEGYEVNSNSVEYTIESDKENVVNFVNTKQNEVIVHYYLKNTGEEYNTDPIRLQEDAHIYGKSGDKYNTSEYINFELQGYSLQMDNNDEYIIPSNASGSFEADVTDVYYYYEDTENKTIDIQAKKQWKMTDDDAQEYRVTLQLIKIVQNNEFPAVDENGVEITETIRGNKTAIFENLKAYENDEKIKYKVKEIKVEKFVSTNTETQKEIWEEVPLNQFKVTYTSE